MTAELASLELVRELQRRIEELESAKVISIDSWGQRVTPENGTRIARQEIGGWQEYREGNKSLYVQTAIYLGYNLAVLERK